MSIDRWFIGGGAEHTPESARRLVYASTGGATGVGGVGDLKVLPLAVPGGGGRVVVGSALIGSKYVGGETQTYMGTVYEQELFTITATGSGAPRADLVVMRVEDPFAAGSPWPEPSDPATAPYVHIRVISGVPAGTTRLQNVPGYENDTAETLARIDLPVSTGTVTAGMIVDLRNLPMPRSERLLMRLNAPSSNADMASATEVQWPPVSADVKIPGWATHAFIAGDHSGAIALSSASSGDFWLRLGNIDTAGTAYNEQGGFGSRMSYPVGSEIAIPPVLRGTTQSIRPYAKRSGGGGSLRSYWGTMLQLDIQWIEKL